MKGLKYALRSDFMFEHVPGVAPNLGFLDLSQTPIASDYPNCYFKVLDNIFTAQECASFIALAESDQTWQPALINTGIGQELDLTYRNSGRILRFDHEGAAKIHQRLLPYVQELVEIKPGDAWEGIVGTPGRVRGTWKLLGFVVLHA